MTRVTIAAFGASRKKVRVFTEGDLVRVSFYRAGKPKHQSWPNTPAGRAEAKAYAKGIADQRLAPITKTPITLRELWNRFADTAFLALRENSKRNYTHYYGKWIAMWGGDFPAENSTLDMMNQFRSALTKKLGIKTVRQAVQSVKRVHKWGRTNRLIAVNDLSDFEFRVSKDERTESPAEYTADETTKILGAFDPHSANQWRAWVALTICANQGVRQNAALHLQWDDIDEDERVVTWRARWDKMGREWSQPIRVGTLKAIGIAAHWREKNRYTGPWVLPQGSSKSKSEVYTLGSLWQALKGAETRSGVAKLERRGGHGLRRMVAGDVAAATGDPALALLSIGDTDLRQANSYLKKRDARVKGAFDQLDADKNEAV